MSSHRAPSITRFVKNSRHIDGPPCALRARPGVRPANLIVARYLGAVVAHAMPHLVLATFHYAYVLDTHPTFLVLDTYPTREYTFAI
jgi:hypothetical protein